MPRLTIERLYHPNVVVHDLRATARNYARLLGIAQWDVRHGNAEITATGSNSHDVTFRLVQPTHAASMYAEYLNRRGEGIHSLCLALGSSASMLDTRAELGGFSVEIAASPPAPADEHCDFSSEAALPAAVAWLADIPKIAHFGIAVANVMDRLPNYASLLGITRWAGLRFDSTPGSLEHSTFRGQHVDNAWFLAITDVADFGFELLESTREPTDYGQTVERFGEGIHHMLVRRGLSDSECAALQSWMTSLGVGIVMSGRVRYGAAEFFYFDTRALLGFLLEVIVTRDIGETPGPPMQRLDLDFSSY
jgi:hypothetical protein